MVEFKHLPKTITDLNSLSLSSLTEEITLGEKLTTAKAEINETKYPLANFLACTKTPGDGVRLCLKDNKEAREEGALGNVAENTREGPKGQPRSHGKVESRATISFKRTAVTAVGDDRAHIDIAACTCFKRKIDTPPTSLINRCSENKLNAMLFMACNLTQLLLGFIF